MNKIGDRLRLLRDEKGYSQADFAEKMNVNRMTINNYENGKRTPDISFAANAAEHFGVTLEFLTGKTEFRNRDDMIESVQKANRFISIVESLPQVEGQSMMIKLTELLESASAADANIPVLIGLISTISEYQRLLASYSEIEENIIRNVAELRWQKIQPALIQWTCTEKTKAISENALDASKNIFTALESTAKMLSKMLVNTLEAEADK